MGRMHAPGKGISQSALPYRRSVPQWLKLTYGGADLTISAGDFNTESGDLPHRQKSMMCTR